MWLLVVSTAAADRPQISVSVITSNKRSEIRGRRLCLLSCCPSSCLLRIIIILSVLTRFIRYQRTSLWHLRDSTPPPSSSHTQKQELRRSVSAACRRQIRAAFTLLSWWETIQTTLYISVFINMFSSPPTISMTHYSSTQTSGLL